MPELGNNQLEFLLAAVAGDRLAARRDPRAARTVGLPGYGVMVAA
jgi:hypothetical protein